MSHGVPHSACHGEMTSHMSFFMDKTIQPSPRRCVRGLFNDIGMAAHHGSCYGLCHGVCYRVAPLCPHMLKRPNKSNPDSLRRRRPHSVVKEDGDIAATNTGPDVPGFIARPTSSSEVCLQTTKFPYLGRVIQKSLTSYSKSHDLSLSRRYPSNRSDDEGTI